MKLFARLWSRVSGITIQKAHKVDFGLKIQLMARVFLISLISLLAVSCAPSRANRIHATDEAKTIATGTWGGEHVRMEVTKTGAEIEFDCAHGQTTEPIALDKRGNFDAPGTFTPEHGRPILRDEAPPSNP